jgi:cytochrome c biogenesis protein
MIMSLNSEGRELRVFAKRKTWEAPKLLGIVPVGQGLALGEVKMKFERVIPITGLQYKCDPGLPVTYFAFAVIMIGVLLASIPHRHVWASIDNNSQEAEGGKKLLFGGTSRKAKVGFELSMDKLYVKLGEQFSDKEKEKEIAESNHV